MTASAKVYVSFEISGLGEDLSDKHLAESADVPTGKISPKTMTLAVAATEEEIDLSNLDVVRGIMIKALDFDVYVDNDYDGVTFVNRFKLVAGEDACWIPYPQGGIAFVNSETAELPTIEYSAWGIAS